MGNSDGENAAGEAGGTSRFAGRRLRVARGNEITAFASGPRKAKREKAMKTGTRTFLIALGLLGCSWALVGAAHAQETDKHHCDMISRGNQGMGFEAAKTTHHFFINPSGGAIEVSANDPADTVSRDAIQHHLQHIAKEFKEGDFDIPAFVHDQVAPGVPAMKRLKADISYEYVATERGARVDISTKNPEALAAIHDFLRFQIEEHQTGDKH